MNRPNTDNMSKMFVKEENFTNLIKEDILDTEFKPKSDLNLLENLDFNVKEEIIIDTLDSGKDNHNSINNFQTIFEDPKLLLFPVVVLHNCTNTNSKKLSPKLSVERLKVYAKHSKRIVKLPLKCVFCQFVARSIKCMIEHRKLHDQVRPFPCMKCEFSTTNPNYLKLHLLTHSESYFQCSYCEFKTKNKYYLSIHIRQHTNNELSCKICGKKLLSSITLRNHMSSVHIPVTGKPYKCDLCGFESNYKSSVPKHMKAVHFKSSQKPFHCHVCKYKTVKKSMLDRHIMKHTGLKPYKCSFCNYATTNSGSLNIHLKVIHDPDPPRPFECSHCAKTFKTKTSLKIHMYCHIKSRTIPCPECDHVANSLHRLRSHLVIHNKALFQCSKCGYKSKFKHSLRLHVVGHYGPMLKCTHCGFTTPNIRRMFAHSKQSHTHFAHECSECGMKFPNYRKTNLRKHIAACHKP